jgi:hypothetical protein
MAVVRQSAKLVCAPKQSLGCVLLGHKLTAYLAATRTSTTVGKLGSAQKG